jgi:hypothetical protein
MTTPRAARYPRMPQPPAPLQRPAGTRAPIGPQAHRAAYAAHKDSAHKGTVGYRCTTCARYLAGIRDAVTAELAAQPPADPTP